MSASKPEIKRIAAPSYIKDIIGCEDDVLLIFNRVQPKSPESIPVAVENTNVSLDLTGNPLEVDLSTGDCTLNESLICVGNLWHDDETEYGSLTVKMARKLLNSELAKHHCQDKIYIYALCDGKDKEKMVVFGARRVHDVLSRTQMFFKGSVVFTNDDASCNLENMKSDHFKDAKSIFCTEPNIKHLIRGTYLLYGHKISPNPNLLGFRFSGSIYCDITWGAFQYSIPEYVDSIEMVITGHKLSSLHSRWNELMLLKNYINVLTRHHNLESTILNESSKSYVDIVASFDEVFTAIEGGYRPPPNTKKSGLNFENLRWEIFTDKLWKMLIYCNTVKDLRSCFHSLFEELAASKLSLNTKSFSVHDTSYISKILIEISHGKIAVPTLTLNQSLALLIELGVEKLKRDYFYILDYCDCMNQEEAIKYWELIDQRNKPSTASVASKSASRVRSERARFTIDPTLTMFNTQQSLSKFKCLLSMHVACSVLCLAQQLSCLQENLTDKIKSCLRNNQIKNNISSNLLFEVKVQLNDDKLKHIKSLNPIALNVKFSSTHKRNTVETIFYHTTRKLFPPAVFDGYDIKDSSESSPCYYVTKCVRYIKKLY